MAYDFGKADWHKEFKGKKLVKVNDSKAKSEALKKKKEPQHQLSRKELKGFHGKLDKDIDFKKMLYTRPGYYDKEDVAKGGKFYRKD